MSVWWTADNDYAFPGPLQCTRILLMDEPTSSLDPIASSKIEKLVRELKEYVTIIIVTHNMRQAAQSFRFHGFYVSR